MHKNREIHKVVSGIHKVGVLGHKHDLRTECRALPVIIHNKERRAFD